MYENLSIVYDKLMDVDYDTYANIIASRKGDEESEKIQVLKKALTSDEARDFINNEYKGTIIPIF